MGSRCPPRQTRAERPPLRQSLWCPRPQEAWRAGGQRGHRGGLGWDPAAAGRWQEDPRPLGLPAQNVRGGGCALLRGSAPRPPPAPSPEPTRGLAGPQRHLQPAGSPPGPPKNPSLGPAGRQRPSRVGTRRRPWGGGGRNLLRSPPGSAWIIIRIFFFIYIFFPPLRNTGSLPERK